MPTVTSKAEFGSDVVVEMLGLLGIDKVAYNPGSSFRGLHDSFVNVPGAPEMVLCCHEEIAVAVAHGYWRATGKPMAAAIHSMVGLQHASMAIYNAWCERAPVVVMGGTGPVSAINRRNWIDWVHTALVQGNQVRDYTKWDDQPGAVADFPESLMRAYRIAVTEPAGPVYLCYDVDLQEQPIATPLQLPDVSRYSPPRPVQADPDALAQAARWLAGAQFPLIVADATCRHAEALPHLEALAELLSAPVVSTGGYNIATNHPLNFSAQRVDMLKQADVVLALDVADVQGSLGHPTGPEYFPDLHVTPDAKVIHISLWDLLNGSWASDFERLAAVDLPITGATRLALPALVDLTRRELERDAGSASRISDRRSALEKLQAAASEQREANAKRNWDARPISLDRVYGELWPLVKDIPWTEVGGSAGRRGGWETTQREQSTASGGATGAGLGLATGTSVGAAYALKDSGRLCFTMLGDGELLYSPSALYTASQQSVPLLAIVNDNRSYGNDEGHQELMARQRNRPVENKGVGIYIEDPSPDFASIAKGFDVEAFTVEDPAQVGPVLKRAVDTITREKRPVLVDILTQRPRR